MDWKGVKTFSREVKIKSKAEISFCVQRSEANLENTPPNGTKGGVGLPDKVELIRGCRTASSYLPRP